jgi:hypothetical protein
VDVRQFTAEYKRVGMLFHTLPTSDRPATSFACTVLDLVLCVFNVHGVLEVGSSAIFGRLTDVLVTRIFILGKKKGKR